MDKRNIVVLGGTGGIGRAIAHRFSQEGCAVYLLGRNLDRLAQAAQAISQQTGQPVQVQVCDLGRLGSIKATFAALPRIDVLINAAGSIPRKSLLETSPEDWQGSWSAKVFGAIESSRVACECMKDAGGGVIIQIIGISGVKLNAKTILTTTANAALMAFTQSLGAQSVDWNVRVVGINPGMTETPRTEDLRTGTGSDAYKAALANLPFKRMAKAEEIAACAWFLASPQASYISGSVIDVDAGTRWRV